MNFLEIVLQGYFNENNREYLKKYFLREYKKAEKEQFFEADEFFSGCLKITDQWKNYLQNMVLERKRELYLMLAGARDGTLSYGEMEGKTIEQKRKETIEYCEQELKDVRPDGIGSVSFTVHLHSLTKGRIAYNMYYDEVEQIKLAILNAKKDLLPQETKIKKEQGTIETKQEQPQTFEELFHNPEHAEPCLKILSELDPPAIDAKNTFIGKAKGIFPLWVKVLKNHKPEPLIKHFKDTVYKDLLNQKVQGLNLTKDASEFRKQYVRLEKGKIELDIKAILSQYSQSGKLGK